MQYGRFLAGMATGDLGDTFRYGISKPLAHGGIPESRATLPIAAERLPATLLLGGVTIVFSVLVLSQLAHALALRSERDSLFTIGLFSNPALLGAVVLSVVLQLAIIYHPTLQVIFKTTGLTAHELLVVVTLPWVVFIAVECEKWLVRHDLIYRERV